MKKVWVTTGVIILAIVIISIVVMSGISKVNLESNNSANISNTISNNSTGVINQSSQNESGTTNKIISLEELNKHNAKNDCWVVYKDKVYDLTSWLTKHPGGVNTILPGCGNTDFEQSFIKKHGTSKASLFMKVAIYMGDLTLQGSIK